MRLRWVGGAAVLRRARSDGVAVSDRAARVRAGGGRRLLHHPRPGARGIVAGTHGHDRATGGADPPEGTGHRRRVLGHGLQLQRRRAEPGAHLLEPEAVRRAARAPSTSSRACWAGSAGRSSASAARSSSRSRRRRFPGSGTSAASSSRCSISRARDINALAAATFGDGRRGQRVAAC